MCTLNRNLSANQSINQSVY